MDEGVSPAKSILAKPLKLLTEEDISQLTREDCRNFLKAKEEWWWLTRVLTGMRKPSWNKSQTIQQVLSLKALFEPGDDSGAGILRKILVNPPRVTTTNEIELSNEFGACGRILCPEDDSPCHRRDSPRSAEFSGGSCHSAAEKDSYKAVLSPRTQGETTASVDQMTIFYSGKVNVYDGIPPEMARSIMHFAANPIDLPENGVFASTSVVSKPMSKEKMMELPQYGLQKANTFRDCDVEGQANRKVSLQRYREKRKDRRFSKAKKVPGITSSSLETFLNLQPRINTGDSQNQTKSPNLSVDLNSEET